MTATAIIEIVAGLIEVVVAWAKGSGATDADLDAAIAKGRAARNSKVMADRAEEEGLFTMSSTTAPVVVPVVGAAIEAAKKPGG